MQVALLNLVETALRVAKQALGKRAGKTESGGLAREVHIVAHCIHKEEGHSYAELVDWVSLMPAVCDLLGINPDAPPNPTTFYHSFDRYAMYIRRALLRIRVTLACCDFQLLLQLTNNLLQKSGAENASSRGERRQC